MNIEKILLKLSNKAYKHDCVPVGAIVVDENNKIIGKGFNKKERTNNPMDHAEIIAIKKAAKRKKQWKLNGCSLYVTMKPCAMCKSVVNESRIGKVFYVVDNTKEEYKNTKSMNEIKYIPLNDNVAEKKYLDIIQNFFKEKRKK